ncbi:MAG: FlgD immunoglobulin-like domain containing protein [Candidatus Ratteibacteria bacterium]
MVRKVLLGCMILIMFWVFSAICQVICTPDKTAVSAKSGDIFVFAVSNPNPPQDISIKVYDANGKYVRTLFEKCATETQFKIPWNLKDADGKIVNPGKYTVKVQTGLSLVLDNTFGKNGIIGGDDTFISPRNVRVDKKGCVYVLDYGSGIIFKFNPDGTPANDIAGKNKIVGPSSPYWVNIAVDEDGRIYGTVGHSVLVYDGKTGAQIYHVGEFFGNDVGWETTKGGLGWPNWVGLNSDYRLYASCPGYSYWAAFDRRKKGKEGGLWRSKGGVPGESGDTDGKKAIYLAHAYYTNRNGITKWIDKDTSVEIAYSITSFTDPVKKTTEQMANVYGVAFDKESGIFLVQRDPVRIIKISDNGFGFDFVKQFASPGNDASKLEFMAPKDAAVSPDGKYLYIIEDGEPISKTNTAPGLARLMKYKITYQDEKQVTINVQ